MYFDSFDSPLGKIHLLADESGLRQLTLCLHHPFEQCRDWQHSPSFLAPYKQQVLEFLEGERTDFDIPLAPEGTEFQHKVWQALRDVPYGETCSYSDIAEAIGNPQACRAVGMANNVNPIPLIIPCHRVIGRDGALVGYRYGLEIKQKLLDMEKETAH
ncbi:methylated-DNA--[protein]-cysteine S-methyltransferase [Enterovibrio paralichthyis]|uniref:methylated-DNA--[protein]-cysteine S-methyltransferase n=1 Tax=Enterovibrio paralichthyis TaxID=2853805 RepID=UPI001C4928D0|nr:methylated-DNA--[protein]-cysteine S-methyltransferase [Enterovibrio paralichthyis]MBV7297686.1 methylated-DNA--[protein]-cysteine S-methyltransferase [Enterovibrio paralichthyis]